MDSAESVTWEHRDPEDVSVRVIDAAGQEAGFPGELDPLGSNAGLIKPFIWQAPRSRGQLVPFYTVPDMDMTGAGCVVDGIPTPCEMVSNEATAQCENNDCGPQTFAVYDKRTDEFVKYVLGQPVKAFWDGWVGSLPPGTEYTGNGNWAVPRTPGNFDSPNRGMHGTIGLENHHVSDLPQKPVPRSAPDPGQPLTPCVKSRLAPYFPGTNLDEIRVQEGGMPSYVVGDPPAYTEENRIYFKKGEYNPHSVQGLSDIGHEITHKVQYDRLGSVKFQSQYLSEYAELRNLGLDHDTAYRNISFEREAYKRGEIIKNDLDNLMRDFGGRDPCPR